MADNSHGLIENSTSSFRGSVAILCAGILGIGYIFGAKQWGLSQTLVTLGPVLVMVLYAALLHTPAFRLRDDQAGDNLYYLGFLYTLTSIATSLLEYTEGRDADVIVTNFGIAVSTTIVGLMLRLYFNQMRGDTVDVERVTRMELAEAARRMRTELDNAVLELKQFQRATLQSVEGSFTTMRELTEETLKTLVTSAEEFSKVSTSSTKERDTQLTETTAKLNKAMVAAAKSFEKIGNQLDLFKSPETLINLEMGEAKETLERFIGDMAATQHSFISRMDADLAKSSETAAAIRQLVSSTEQMARAATETQFQLAERMNRMEQWAAGDHPNPDPRSRTWWRPF